MSEFDCGWVQDEDDIEIVYLTEQKGVEKYGNCIACKKSSKDDRDMIRILFGDKGNCISVCICSECRKKLKEML